MTSGSHDSGFPEEAERRVRVRVPPGFFERLIASCNIRAVTQSTFNINDPRPESSKTDPVLLFKILLLEYFLDVSNEALRQEFISHPGLSAFLSIHDEAALPLPEEIVHFRVKLGWLRFRDLLDKVIREAKRNGLPEVDCAILEKRHENPLIEIFKELPSAHPPAATGVSSMAPKQESMESAISRSGDPYSAPTPPMDSETFPGRTRSSSPPGPFKREQNSVYVESTLHAAAQMIWADHPDMSTPAELGDPSGVGAEFPNGFLEDRQDLAGSSPPTRPISIDVEKMERDKSSTSLQSKEPGGRPGTSSRNDLPSKESRMAASRSPSNNEPELDPLGIDSYLHDLLSSNAGDGSTRVDTDAEASKRWPLPHAEYGGPSLPEGWTDTSVKTSNRAPSDENPREEAPGSGHREPIYGPRRGASPFENPVTRGTLPDQGEPESLASVGPNLAQRASPDRDQTKPLFSAYEPRAAQNRIFTSDSVSKVLYVAVPVVVLLLIYLLIGVLNRNQPTPIGQIPPAAPSTPSAATPKEAATPATQQLPPATAVTKPSIPEAGASGQNLKNPASKTEGPTENRATAAPPPVATEKHPPAQLNAGVNEDAKKLELIRHMKQAYNLDFQPGLYTYKELRDINDRMEQAIKKGAKR